MPCQSIFAFVGTSLALAIPITNFIQQFENISTFKEIQYYLFIANITTTVSVPPPSRRKRRNDTSTFEVVNQSTAFLAAKALLVTTCLVCRSWRLHSPGTVETTFGVENAQEFAQKSLIHCFPSAGLTSSAGSMAGSGAETDMRLKFIGIYRIPSLAHISAIV